MPVPLRRGSLPEQTRLLRHPFCLRRRGATRRPCAVTQVRPIAVRRMGRWSLEKMRTMSWAVVAALLAVMDCCGFRTSCPDMRFARLRPADRVMITSNMNDALRTICDPVSISNLVAFAEAHESGWGTPWFGPPVALVRAHFYSGSRFLGDLGVGTDFLTAQGCGSFQSRRVSASDRTAVMQLFGVPVSVGGCSNCTDPPHNAAPLPDSPLEPTARFARGDSTPEASGPSPAVLRHMQEP